MTRKYSHKLNQEYIQKSIERRQYSVVWPPQVSELKQLDEWKHINELNNLPDVKNKNNFKIMQFQLWTNII